MKPRRFYEHFACAYGTLWLLLVLIAVLTKSGIRTGLFGLIGFPVIALVYAFCRTSTSTVNGRSKPDDPNSFRLFLETHPIYRDSPTDDQDRGYALWMNQRNAQKQ